MCCMLFVLWSYVTVQRVFSSSIKDSFSSCAEIVMVWVGLIFIMHVHEVVLFPSVFTIAWVFVVVFMSACAGKSFSGFNVMRSRGSPVIELMQAIVRSPSGDVVGRAVTLSKQARSFGCVTR